MLNIARLALNVRSGRALRDIQSPEELHVTVMKRIPDGVSRTDASLLYRLEVLTGLPVVTIQASMPLSLDGLTEGERPYAVEAIQKDASAVLQWVDSKPSVNYLIHIKTIKRVKDKGVLLAEADKLTGEKRTKFLQRVEREEAKGRAVEIPVPTEEICDWWTRIASRRGLDVTSALVSPIPASNTRGSTPGFGAANLTPRSSAMSASTGKRVPIRSARIEGSATITDSEAVRHALTGGIGQGRAFGLGMLSLAP